MSLRTPRPVSECARHSGVSKALLRISKSCFRSTGRRVLGSPCSLRSACHHLVAASAAQKGCSASSQRQGCRSQGKLWRSGGDCCHGRKPCRKQAAAPVRLGGEHPRSSRSSRLGAASWSSSWFGRLALAIWSGDSGHTARCTQSSGQVCWILRRRP